MNSEQISKIRANDETWQTWHRDQISELLDEIEEMREALKQLRMVFRDQVGIGLRDMACFCKVPAATLSEWTSDPVTSEPDIVCRTTDSDENAREFYARTGRIPL